MTMSTVQYAPSEALSMPESLALGLLGAGTFIGVAVLAKNPQARKVLGRVISSPEVREIGIEMAPLLRRVFIESVQRFADTAIALLAA